ncbi:MAG TPA: M23 family metallopeptidase [Longimicrobiales bacterium]
MKRFPTTGLLLLLLTTACARGPESPAPRTAATRDRYQDDVLRSDLAGGPAYREWSAAAHRALRDRLSIKPSFKEILYFLPETATAVGYRLELRRGQRLQVDIDRRMSGRVFAEVFEEIGGGEPIFRLVRTLPSSESHLSFEATTDGPHVVRLQPEMFKSGQVVVTITTTASLTFPVFGKSTRAIGSVFGDPRDGGQRDHEGIDIFAPAGTDVLAVAPGIIRTVNSTTLGGNVVWQEDPVRHVSYYYAHLTEQKVRRGDHVAAGDVVGTVGNTGNARTTPSHLHFGVYKPGRVAIDPVPFIFNQPSDPVQPVLVDLNALGQARYLDGARVLRTTPAGEAVPTLAASSSQPVTIIGAVREWYRVMLSDGTQGFVRARDIATDFSSKASH